MKTRSLKSRVKIFKTSERTVCSKASWLPNQICTLALRVADKPEDCFRLLSDDVIINHKPTTILQPFGVETLCFQLIDLSGEFNGNMSVERRQTLDVLSKM